MTQTLATPFTGLEKIRIQQDGWNVDLSLDDAKALLGVAQGGGQRNILGLAWGDSRIQYSNDSATFTNMKLQGIQRWIQVLSNGAIQMPGSQNFGVAGDTTYQALARSYLVSSSSAAFGLILNSTNDRAASPAITANESIANINQQIRVLTASGKLAVVIAETPRGDTTFTSRRLPANGLAQHMQVYRWILAQRGRPGVIVVDPWPSVCSPYSTTGDAIVDMFYDGLHPSQYGAFTIAQAVVAALAGRFPSVPMMLTSNSDLFDATYNPRGNLIANGMLDGTTGTHTGATGTSSTGSLATISTGFTNAMTAQASYLGETWQKMVIGGTPSVSNPSVIFRIDGVAANFAAGDVLRGRCRFAVEAGASGIAGVQLSGRVLYADATSTTTIDGDYDPGGGLCPPVAHSGMLQTPDYTVASASAVSVPSLRFQVLGVNGSAASATIYVARMEWRKVHPGDPL